MILTDAGPLVALVNHRDAGHARCSAAVREEQGPLVTTWPAFTEAMHLLGRVNGYRAQARLWMMVQPDLLVISDVSATMLARMPALMEQYRDLPMDFADASLVALAEERGYRRVFSLDKHFLVYRLPRGRAFEVVPPPD